MKFETSTSTMNTEEFVLFYGAWKAMNVFPRGAKKIMANLPKETITPEAALAEFEKTLPAADLKEWNTLSNTWKFLNAVMIKFKRNKYTVREVPKSIKVAA